MATMEKDITAVIMEVITEHKRGEVIVERQWLLFYFLIYLQFLFKIKVQYEKNGISCCITYLMGE